MRTIPDVLPGHVLRNITSLVLVWPEKLRISGGFKSQKQRKEFEHSNWYQHTFPALVHLRICFKADSNGGHSLSMAPLPNSIGIQDDKSRRLAEGIWSNMFLKNVLHMVEKVCPPTTTVTITVPLWTWFEGFEESFIRTQGIDATKPQMAEIGGLKLWKVCSKRASKYGRAGFWVHTEVNNVKFFKREPHRECLTDLRSFCY